MICVHLRTRPDLSSTCMNQISHTQHKFLSFYSRSHVSMLIASHRQAIYK